MNVPNSPEELVKEMSMLFADLKSGRVHVAVARAMANVAQVILKGHELIDAKNQLKPPGWQGGIDPADLSLEEWERLGEGKLLPPINFRTEAPPSEPAGDLPLKNNEMVFLK